VRTADGFYRENTIAFKADSTHESNKFVSRQHAHIEWNSDAGSFYLFADEGGIPPGNKIKIRQPDSGTPVKLQNTQIGHRLQDGDQIILGDSALLQFNYAESR
jgi:pSer/pThr/pTyr-binding forkhead associated (FHA) protein